MKVAVFIDWQNAYNGARDAFGLRGEAPRRGVFSPLAVSRLLASRNKRGDAGELVCVEVHRGLPSPNDEIGHGAVTKHAEAWAAEDPKIVVPRLRPLKFNKEKGKDEEKGIDVALACGAVEWAIGGDCDVAIIFSHDSDLLPPVETICRVCGPDHVETASWWSKSHYFAIPPAKKSRRRSYGVVNHRLGQDIFDAVETAIRYSRYPGKRR